MFVVYVDMKQQCLLYFRNVCYFRCYSFRCFHIVQTKQKYVFAHAENYVISYLDSSLTSSAKCFLASHHFGTQFQEVQLVLFEK